jgi:hypothetical protein
VALGSYPSRGDEHNRIKITAGDERALDEAEAWLRATVAIVGPADDGDASSDPTDGDGRAAEDAGPRASDDGST